MQTTTKLGCGTFQTLHDLRNAIERVQMQTNGTEKPVGVV